MNETRVPAGPERNPVWVTRLSELIDRLYLVIRVNAVWWMLSLLGLMVAGVGPASCAAAEAFIAARHGERVRVLPLMWPHTRTPSGPRTCGCCRCWWSR